MISCPERGFKQDGHQRGRRQRRRYATQCERIVRAAINIFGIVAAAGTAYVFLMWLARAAWRMLKTNL